MDKNIYRTVNADSFPEEMEIAFVQQGERHTLKFSRTTWEIDGERQGLRYGENPDQQAALYRLVAGNLTVGAVRTIQPGRFLASDVELLQSGKHPGKINITDADAALNILRHFGSRPAAVIVKHNNPSGVALGTSLEEAYTRALMADRTAAFGGVIAINGEIDTPLAEAITSYYAEVVAAPAYTAGALAVFARKKNLRVMRIGNMARLSEFAGERYVDFHSLIDGGLVVQWSYLPKDLSHDDLHAASTSNGGVEYRIDREPSEREKNDMRFGWFVESGVTSNSIIYVKDEVTVSVGTGEQDRVGVAEIARDKAYRKCAERIAFERYGTSFQEISDRTRLEEITAEVQAIRGGLTDSVMVSDAFFPFRDGAEVGLREGVSAILQPGGANRDHEIIESCNHWNATMVFTGQRSFRH